MLLRIPRCLRRGSSFGCPTSLRWAPVNCDVRMTEQQMILPRITKTAHSSHLATVGGAGAILLWSLSCFAAGGGSASCSYRSDTWSAVVSLSWGQCLAGSRSPVRSPENSHNQQLHAAASPPRLCVKRKEQAKMARRYFEDLTDGEPLHCQKLIITREDIIEFAKRFDPQPFHTDENAAKESMFGGLIASQ